MSRAYVYYFPRPSISPYSIRSSHGSDFWEVIKTFLFKPSRDDSGSTRNSDEIFLPTKSDQPGVRRWTCCWPSIGIAESRADASQIHTNFPAFVVRVFTRKVHKLSKASCWCSFDRDLHIKTPQYQRNNSISSDFPYFIRSLRVRLHGKKCERQSVFGAGQVDPLNTKKKHLQKNLKHENENKQFTW